MTFIDDLNKEHDPANIAAKEAAKKTAAFTKIAVKIINSAKDKISAIYDKHALSGYYGYSYDGNDYKDVIISSENKSDQGETQSFQYFYKSDYSMDDMNEIRSILEEKLRALGLKNFSVSIVHRSKRSERRGGWGRHRNDYTPAYIIRIECTW